MNSKLNNKNNTGEKQVEPSSLHENVFGVVIEGKIQVETIIDRTQREKIMECCKQEVNYTRIYLLRHPPYLKDDDYKEYRRLKDLFKEDSKLVTDIATFTQLDNGLKIDFSKVDTELFNGVFQDPQNTILIHHPLQSAKNRFKETVEYIQEKYRGITTREEEVRGSIKGVYEMLSLANAATDIANIVCKMVQPKDEEIPQNYKGKSIVILGSRSHSHFLNLDKFNVNGKRESVETFIGDGYNFVDLYDNFKRVNNKDNLIITPGNYHEITKIFGLEGLNIPILNLQNGLNVYFQNHPEEYEKYLFSQNEELRVFCISKLLSDKENQDNIKKVIVYYNETVYISEREEQLLIGHLDITDIKELYADLCSKRKVTNITSDENIESLSKVLQIQYRSLDTQIKNNQNGVLERKLYRIEKESNEKQDNNFVHHEIDINYMLSSGEKRFVLPANVGSGKSIWMSQFAKDLILNDSTYEVAFFEGKDFNNQYGGNSVSKILDKLLNNFNEKSIVFIDAIDEITDQKIKNQVMSMISKSKNRIVISGRLSDFNENINEGFITLGFTPIFKEDFINLKVLDSNLRKEILDNLEKSSLAQEVEGNPLLLNFVCILANLDDGKEQEYKKVGIKKLVEIKNKTQLYESITRLIIYEHFKLKGNPSSAEELDIAIEKKLGQYAFDLFQGEKLDISDEYLFKLSIIFKKSETGTYQFIHNSFYEFFLAKHLSSCNNGNEQIYQIRDQKAGVKNWNVWNSVQPVVLFYGEILANNKNYDALFELLGEKGVLKNDDIFGQGYFIGLEILYKTEKQLNGELNSLLTHYSGENFKKVLEIQDYLLQIATLKKLYLDILLLWNDEMDLLGKSFLFHNFQKNISYQENIFAQCFVNKIIQSGLSTHYEFIKSRQYHKILIQMGLSTLMTYNEAFKKSSENENLNRGFPEINDNPSLNYYYGNLFLQDEISMYNEYYSKYFYAGEYFMQAAKTGYKDAMEKLFLCIDYLIKDKSNHNIIMNWCKGILNEKVIYKIYDYFNHGYFDKDKIYKSLIELLEIKPRNVKVNETIIHYFKDFLVQMDSDERAKLSHYIFPDSITHLVGFEQICFEDYLLVDEKTQLNRSHQPGNQEDKSEKKRELLKSFYYNLERDSIISAVIDFKAILEINGVENKEESYGLLKDFEASYGEIDGDIDKNALNQLTGVYDIYDYFYLNLGYPFSITDLKQREYIGMYDFLKQARTHNVKIS